MKFAYIIIVFFAVIACSMCRETTRAIDRLDNNSSNNYDNSNVRSSSLEPRKHKPYHSLFLLMGGLQSLVSFVVIKIKVVLVTLTIIGVVALALKIFGVFKYTSYFYKNDYLPVGPPPEFTGYSGPLPPNSPSPYDHDSYGNDWSSYSDHYARSTNDRRETATQSQFPKSVNMTEIVYSFMNANRDDCRARLICEFEVILMRSPFFDYFMRHGITRHQLPESGSRSEDCTTYYTKCVDASANRQ